MAKKTNSLTLFLHSGSDYRITDQDGRAYTTEEAKAAWQAGKVTDYNGAFYRLAVHCDFDVEIVKRQYAEIAQARGK
jgi:hypothetical protein